jgi:hypothetical protein
MGRKMLRLNGLLFLPLERKKMKKWLVSMSAALLLSSLASVSANNEPRSIDVYHVPMHFVFDGEEYAPPEEQKGFIYEGSTYVPLRFISYALNKAVGWEGESYTVTVSESQDQDSIMIHEYKLNRKVRQSRIEKVDMSEAKPSSIQAYFQKVNYIFHGLIKSPAEDLPGMIIHDTLYVPMRFFSESVGQQIEWDPKTYSVVSKSEAFIKELAKASEPKQPAMVPKQPVQAPVLGGGGGFGGGGGTQPAKKTEQAIVDQFKPDLERLENEAANYFLGKLIEYNTLSEEEKKERKPAMQAEAQSKLDEFDRRFESLMGSMKSELNNNQLGESKIDELRDQYEEKKALAKNANGID